MLKTLYIKNFALIEELSIEFGSGLNIITGETGAGKSILIGALSLVLGERANSEVVRKGAEKAIIEVTLDASNNKRVDELLKANEIDFSDEMILRREISLKGQSRCFINDTPTTLAILKEVGDLSIDLHGQHDHQSLLRIETHLRLLDEYGGLGGLVEEFQKRHCEFKEIRSQIDELRKKEQVLQEKKHLYEFQIREIDALAPQPNEEDSLESEQTILENAEKLFSATNDLHEILYAADDSVHNQLVAARNMLEDLARIDKIFSEAASDAYSAQALVDEINKFVQRYNSRIDFNPERLEELRERLSALNSLRKKYGRTTEELLAYRHQIGEEVQLAENFEEEIQKREQQLQAVQADLSKSAHRLSEKRMQVAKRLSKVIVDELKRLGIPEGQFDVDFSHIDLPNGDVIIGNNRYEATNSGYDHIEFLLSTNIGEDPKPLAKVASGGEISRIMLAIKTVLAKSERLPILVFDEIDTGISGKIAQVVGFSIKELSRYHQIIVITHLAQIAALGQIHFRVRKETVKQRTVSIVERLNPDEHQKEVARLLSGTEITDASLRSAQELIDASK
ncbi:MAG: DNA repair protein RecN [Chlorobiales bacterium]|nr:DNA repair protein RecN [Chlorobiales bacterium]